MTLHKQEYGWASLVVQELAWQVAWPDAATAGLTHYNCQLHNALMTFCAAEYHAGMSRQLPADSQRLGNQHSVLLSRGTGQSRVYQYFTCQCSCPQTIQRIL